MNATVFRNHGLLTLRPRHWRPSLFSRTAVAAFCAVSAVMVHAASGDLDTSFGAGTGKVVTMNIGNPTPGISATAQATALQPDGKLLVAGSCIHTYVAPANYKADFCLVRYDAAGVLDPSFNGSGKVFTAIAGSIASASAVAALPGGKIQLAGTCAFGASLISNPGYQFCLVRYLSNGSLDTTFGSGGIVATTGTGSNDLIFGMAVLPDGNTVVAGRCIGASGGFRACFARYLPDGSLDTSFQSTGKVTTSVQATIAAFARQPDGKLVVAGSCPGSANNFCVARFDADGNADLTFNSTGLVVTTIGTSPAGTGARSILLYPDGNILIVGPCQSGGAGNRFCVARYLPNGAPDLAFNGSGQLILAAIGSNDYATGLRIQPDLKILISGSCTSGSVNNFCLVRLNANGSVDSTFGSTGTAVASMPSSTTLSVGSLTQQPDGNIVVAGGCGANPSSSAFCAARFLGGPGSNQVCSMDVDGDGQITSTTDGLLLVRAASGITGAAITNGVGFNTNATRTTWPQLRDFLMLHCGMSLTP